MKEAQAAFRRGVEKRLAPLQGDGAGVLLKDKAYWDAHASAALWQAQEGRSHAEDSPLYTETGIEKTPEVWPIPLECSIIIIARKNHELEDICLP